MPRLLFTAMMVGLAGAAGAAGGCSHAQKVAQATPPQPAPAPAPAAETPRANPMVVTADGADQKQGDQAIYFDFDSADLRDDARPVLQKVADSARARHAALEIDGNCDEVGTTEYNLALGEVRARAARDYLVHMGVPAGSIKTLSYGAERPKDAGHDEAAHAKNRRDDLIVR